MNPDSIDTSSDVERVARALAEWDWIGTPGFKWDNTRDPERDNWLTMARAAIAALSPSPVREEALEEAANYKSAKRLKPILSHDDEIWNARMDGAELALRSFALKTGSNGDG